MFNSSLLKGALAAVALLETVAQAQTGRVKTDFPDFTQKMIDSGSNFNWEPFDIVTETGYILPMFRITGDANGNELDTSKGPLLLVHGMFSGATEWFDRTDLTLDSLPIRLAKSGYDVWIGCSRGRENALGHQTLDMLIPADEKQYWDFTFEQIGKEDMSSMIDKIIATRDSDGDCKKVTLVTHSTGANSSLVLAADEYKQANAKVGQVVNVAPCLQINLDNFWLPFKDQESVQAFYSLFDNGEITNLYGPNSEAQLAAFCSQPEPNPSICAGLIYPQLNNELYKQTSLKDFQHVQQNTVFSKFMEFEDLSQPRREFEDYDIYEITGIPVSAIMSNADTVCPIVSNSNLLSVIPGWTVTAVDALSHTDLIKENSEAFFQEISSSLLSTAPQVTATGICPVVAQEVAAVTNCGDDSDDECNNDDGDDDDSDDGGDDDDDDDDDDGGEVGVDAGGDIEVSSSLASLQDRWEDLLRTRLEFVETGIRRYARRGRGDPELLIRELNLILDQMDSLNLEVPDVWDITGYSTTLRATQDDDDSDEDSDDSGSGSDSD